MIHVAGPFVEWQQRCARCGAMLNDYRNAAWPKGQPAPTGFVEGACVEVFKQEYMTAMTVVDTPPDCEPVS